MSTVAMPTDLFVRIKDGEIVEKNVLRLHITNRGLPVSYFTRVQETPAPSIPAFHSLVTDVVLRVDGTVVQTHTLVEQSLDEVLASNLVYDSANPLAEPTRKLIQDIDPQVVAYIYGRVSDYFHARLNAFAAERQYSSIETLIGYKSSIIPNFASEAVIGEQQRDKMWTALLTYFGGVKTGETPIPVSQAEIDALVPHFTWDQPLERPAVDDAGDNVDPPTDPENGADGE